MDTNITFSFGQNWLNYLKTLTPEMIEEAAKDFDYWLGKDFIKDKRVLDVGSGSGLSSFCIHSRECKELVSFDVDPKSVEATSTMASKAGNPINWRILQGSVLDKKFLNSLGTFDLVYSWGVLHHTGDMWKSLGNISILCNKGGLLWIGLYTRTEGCEDEYQKNLREKQEFNDANNEKKKMIIEKWVNRVKKRRGSNWNATKQRGMSVYFDIIDWLGGLPYEIAAPDDVKKFYSQRGFNLKKITVGPGPGAITVYLFEKA